MLTGTCNPMSPMHAWYPHACLVPPCMLNTPMTCPLLRVPRSVAACTHQDFEDELKLIKGFTTIKFAKAALKVGTISVCGECSDKKEPEIMLQADGVTKKKLSFDWDRNTEWNFNDPKCATVTETLDARVRQLRHYLLDHFSRISQRCALRSLLETLVGACNPMV